MEGGVNINMGVSGVNEVKRHMKDVQNSAKTLNTALALNEKEFKANGDAEAYMSKKSELLNVKIEQQKSIIHDAETALKQMTDNGVDKASKAFQDMQQQVNIAKGELIDAETALANISDSADTASVNVGFANQELQNIGNGISYQNVTDSLDKITSGLESVIKKAWNAGKALVTATLGAGEWADELSETAEKYSTPEWVIDPETLQRMQYASEFIETDVDAIINARKKLNKGLAGEDKDVWAFLHDNNIETEGKNAEQLFWDVGEAIMAMSKDADQELAAQKALGRSWAELKPLFNAGSEAYKAKMEEASVVTNEQVENLSKMDDSLKKAQSEWDVLQKQVLEAFSGPMTQALDAISGVLKEFNEYLQTPEGKAMLEQMGQTVSDLISDLTQIEPKEVVAGLKGVVDGIQSALEWISKPENQKLVIGGLEAILGGWAVLKLSGTALDVLKLINGITGLTSGTASAAGTTAGTSWASAFATAAMKAAPFLAFLYTLLNPSSGSDPLGNNDLYDENGNLTAEGQKVQEELGEDMLIPLDDKGSESSAPVLDLRTKPYEPTSLEDADWRPSYMQGGGGNYYNPNMPIIEAADKMEEAAETPVGNTSGTSSTEDGSGNVLTGIPAVIAAALKGWKIVMNGELVAALVAPQVNALIGEGILNP